MTLRQNILDNLYNGLQNITEANGYDNTIVSVHKNLLNTSTINTYPVLSIQMGSEVIQQNIEGYQEAIYSLDVIIIGYVQTNDVTTSVESLISDLKRFFNKDNNLSSTVVSNLLDIDYIQSYEIKEVNPYLAYSNNIASYGLLLKVEYIDFYEPTSVITLSAPVLSSPVNGYTEAAVRQSLNWESVTDAQFYHVRIYNNSGVLTIDQDNLVNTSFTIPADISFNDGDVITWKVRAKTNQIYSEWSETRNYTINETIISPLNPNQITSNNLWLRSDLGITEISGKVSQWNDQSSGGSNFTQATAGNRPTKTLNAFNSKPSIFYNPVFASAGMNLAYNDTTSKYAITTSNQASFMITLMTDGTNFDLSSGYFTPIERSNTSNGGQWGFTRGVNTGPVGYTLGYPFPSGDYAVIPIALNVPHQIIVTSNNGVTNIYLDGKLIRTITVSYLSISNNANTFLNIGQFYNSTYSSGRFTGHIFEAGFWTKVLSASEITSLYQYHLEYFNL